MFPVGLLIAGYGTACLGALLLSMLGVEILATGLTFWLGGAVAVIFWGGVWAYSRKTMSLDPIVLLSSRLRRGLRTH